MNRPRLVRSLGFLVAGILSGACATTRYTQSRIEALPPEVTGRTGSRAVLEVEDLTLRIQIHDRTPEKEALRYLKLSIVFDTDAAGYSFDPGEVVLRTASGHEWHGAQAGSVPLNRGALFNFAFGAPVEREERPELVIGGLARGSVPLDPVRVVLSRERKRSIDRVYWLEAVGQVLLGPYAGM